MTALVISADSVNSFKNRLDKHWLNKKVYDYEADLCSGQ